jgi:hypothetical protein
MQRRLIIRNPSEYINIGSLNIYQSKINQYHTTNNLSHATKDHELHVYHQEKIYRRLQKYVYLDFMHFIPPTNFVF